MRRANFGAGALGAAALLSSGMADANGRFPASNQFVFSPTDENLVVLRATYGILPSRDNGATWSFLCEDALGLPADGYKDPSIGLTRDNSLLVGVNLGLDVSPDVGCTWRCSGGPLTGQLIVDLAVRPNDPSSAVVVTGTYVKSDASNGQTFSQVFETTNNGASWHPVGVPIPPDVLVTTVDVAKSDPDRLYVSGTRGFGVARKALLFVSLDKGATWNERPLPDAQYDRATEDAVFIGGIDPTNADRVYLRSSGLATGGRSRLTVTTDAGDTFSTAHEFTVPQAGLGVTGEMQGFALSPDGRRVYIGSQQDGLWVAGADLAFHKTSSVHVQCIAARGSELWVCSDAVSGFVAGVSTDEGATFTPKMRLITSIQGPIACGPDTTLACYATAGASQCPAAFASFCTANGGTAEKCDPVTSAGPAGAGSAAAPATRGSSSCTSAGVTGGHGASGALAAVIGVVAAGGIGWRGRRSSRKRKTP